MNGPSCCALNSTPCCAQATIPRGCSQPMTEHSKDAKSCETQDFADRHFDLRTPRWPWQNYTAVYILSTQPSFLPSLSPPQGSDLHHSRMAHFLPKCFPQETSCTSSAILASASQRTQSNISSVCQALCYMVEVQLSTRETWSLSQGAHCLEGLTEMNT